MRVWLVALTLLGSSPVFGQPPPDDPAVDRLPPVDDPPPAVTLFLEGRALLEAGNAAEACSKFEASFKLDAAAAGTMLNLGLCNESVGKLATAIRWFRRAQARAAENKLTETEEAAKDKSTALSVRIATVKLAVTAPAGAVVTVDGTKVDEVEYGRLELDAGPHSIDLTSPPLPAVHRKLDVIDGVATTVTMQIVPPTPIVKKYEVVDVDAPVRARALQIAIVGGTFVLGAGVIGLVGKYEYDRGESPKDWDRWKSLVRYGATPLFLAGAAAITYSVILRRGAHGKERREVVMPVIAPGHAGLAFSREF